MNKPPPNGSLLHQINRFVRGKASDGDSDTAIESQPQESETVNRVERHSAPVIIHHAAPHSGSPDPQGVASSAGTLPNNWHVAHTSIDIPEEPSVPSLPTAAPNNSENNAEGSNMTQPEEKKPLIARFWRDLKVALGSSLVNILLIFVPIGIAFGAMEKSMGDDSPISPIVTFSMNAIAIIPLAYLLSFATECVASKLGDTVGALMNVTFGNAVELIILIALVDNQIGIVQASLLGSILANLLLILGMCFLFGGLRFQEQLYNSKVTQMSASLLSLSVISLLLPTVFHVSFNNRDMADDVVLKLSRGTSIILLVIYIIYLLFQLKSHSYIYESTPQEKIDEESHPGVLADILDSSSSSDSSNSSSESSDSDGDSSFLHRRRLRKALKRHRKHSVTSQDTDTSLPLSQYFRGGSSNSRATGPHAVANNGGRSTAPQNGANSENDADADAEGHSASRPCNARIVARDFAEHGSVHMLDEAASTVRAKRSHRKKDRKRNRDKKFSEKDEKQQMQRQPLSAPQTDPMTQGLPCTQDKAEIKRGFFPPLPFFLQPTQPNHSTLARPAFVRRAHSLPDISSTTHLRPPSPRQTLRVLLPNDRTRANVKPAKDEVHEDKHQLSRTSAVLLLLVSTGLVAACAEFLVDTIDYMVEHTSVSQAFIGLIILPIVGNAAEHVTAVAAACKNKMDLAIAVSLGSSIQIALFVTPVVVLLGWCLNTDMSLYFTLFETVSLFVSAFIVNYLVMDGRTNYLEGALLISTYVIIAVAAFFYPECRDQSPDSGPNFSYC